MNNSSSVFYNYIINVDPKYVTPRDYYRTIFSEGELQKTGVQNDRKYNALIHLCRDKFIYLHDELDNLPDYEDVYSARINYLTYAGETGEEELARELHAFSVKVIFPDNMDWQRLHSLFNRHLRSIAPRMKPTFVVEEGCDLQFVYVLEEPIPMYAKYLKKLTALHNTLSREIHKLFEEICEQPCKKPRQGGLYARHPLVGTLVNDELCCAYRTGELYTLDDINMLVPKTQRLHYQKADVSLEEAKQLWPAWYHYRIEQKREIKGQERWILKPEVYNWFIGFTHNQENIDVLQPGVLQALASYAAKTAMDISVLTADILQLSDMLAQRYSKDTINHHQDAALQLFAENPEKLIRWSITYIEKLSGLKIPRQKRHYRKRGDHLARLHKAQSKQKAVQAWRRKHPEGTRAKCAQALNIQWKTADRWWQEQTEPDKEKPQEEKAPQFVCGCANPDIEETVQRWFWEEAGNYYKRTVYKCRNCNRTQNGKARIDNSAM